MCFFLSSSVNVEDGLILLLKEKWDEIFYFKRKIQYENGEKLKKKLIYLYKMLFEFLK